MYFVLYAEERTNVTYFPNTKEHFELSAIQKLLDYSHLDIDYSKITSSNNSNQNNIFLNSARNSKKTEYSFETLTLEVFSW
jgi:hypothetical protein